MKGTIKTYLPEKKYGFIKGDDGKDYFFHESEFRDKSQISNLCDEAYVSFEQTATPRGYKAKNCTLIDESDIATYIVPDEFITSKSNGVHGWDIIIHGEWIVHGTSRDSPDAAKKDAINHANQIGANALINLEYYKTTGSEPGTGRGTHRYTIHNFRGRAVTLAKRNSKGSYRAEELPNLNKQAESIKNTLLKKTNASKRKRNFIWLTVFALSLAVLTIEPAVIFGLIIFGFIFGRSTEYDYWLEKA